MPQWAQRMDPPSDRTAYLNILDTHDGIGLMGVNGILSPEDIRYIINMAAERGAQISYKRTEGYQDEPYEINRKEPFIHREDSAYCFYLPRSLEFFGLLRKGTIGF